MSSIEYVPDLGCYVRTMVIGNLNYAELANEDNLEDAIRFERSSTKSFIYLSCKKRKTKRFGSIKSFAKKNLKLKG